MANGWTPERRARQAESIKNWKPWEKSTGPRTEAGKAVVSRNGDKGGLWAEVRELRKVTNELLKEQRELLGRMMS